jgi:hypothetical protein
MSVHGSFTFIIRGNDLDFDYIAANMKLQPTSTKIKGQPVTKVGKMPNDKWSYKVTYMGYEELHIGLETFLNDLQPSKEFIREISKVHDVYIFFSFCSDFAQMGFVLQPTVIQALAELKIRFEVHVLSFGMVEK